MAGITQQIPSFVQGISEQPDFMKVPGQVVDLKNGIPDVTRGLVKSPGGKLVSAITPSSGIAAIPHLSGQTTVGSGGTAGNLAMTSLSSGVHSCTAGGSGTSCVGSTTVRITID